MRAARFHAYGPPSNLVVEEVADPTLSGPKDVRIAVKAAAINPIDWKIRGGKQRGALRYTLPWIGGLDVSGEVVEVGSGVTRFAVGDAVYGCPDHNRPGAYAEQVVVDEGFLAKKPPSLTHAEAASIPLVGLTAWQCLLPRIGERPGQHVFIQAGSGGVGTFAIQLAKHHGCRISTTCSPRNADFVRELGADEVVDYRTQNWWEALSDIDVILDALGGEERARALEVVNRGGRVASIVSGLPAATEAYGPTLGVVAVGLGIVRFAVQGRLRGVDTATVIRKTRADQLEQITALLESGAIRPILDKVYPLDDIAEAHAYGETGRIRGKVVLEP
jgi:NADPH:quinone reductase-like Zn-dependent oxidoreductase